MKTASIASVLEGILTFTVGDLQPDFICADPVTMVDIVDAVHEWCRQKGDMPTAMRKHGRQGVVIAGAIVVMDRSVPYRHIKFENYSSPYNPHLNGTRPLEYR